MPAPSPAAIVENPPPLNSFTRFPFVIDEFPADLLLGRALGNLAPVQEPATPAASPQRKEIA